MRRRNVLQLSGAAVASAIGAGYLVGGEESPQEDGEQGDRDPIEFDDPEELLLEPDVLPGDGWEELEREDGDILDVKASFLREFEDDEEVDGEEGSNWLVTSAVAGRDDEGDAADVYEVLETDWTNTIGEARVMDLELATEAKIAGYDGLTAVIFRDVNCVASVGFTDCGTLDGPCYSDVARVEELARIQQGSWRAPAEDEEGDEDDDESTGGDGPDPITFEGSGQAVTDAFDLIGGFVIAEMEHTGGDSNFQVELVDDESGERVELFVNEIGEWAGETGETVDEGTYVLDINADGEWAVTLRQPRPTDGQEPPIDERGETPRVLGPYDLEGRQEATGSHQGDGNYIVRAHDAEAAGDEFAELIFNELGEFEGSTTFSGPGLSWITVDADGEWELTVE